MNWRDVKRTVVRAPQILSRKTNIGTHTVDEDYDLSYGRILSIESALNQLVKETEKNRKSHKIFIQKNEEIAQQFMVIFTSNLQNDDTLEDENFKQLWAKKESAEKYYEIIRDMAPAINMELDMLEEKINKTVKEILKMIKQIRKNHKDREMELIDMDKFSKSIEKLKNNNSNNALTVKQQENLLQLQEKFENSTKRYDTINNIMKREFPVFFNLTSKIMVPLLQIIYWSFDTIHYQYFQALSLMKPDFGIESNDFSLSKCDEVVYNYQQTVKSVLQQIESLKIIDFSKNYLKRLMNTGSNAGSANSSFNNSFNTNGSDNQQQQSNLANGMANMTLLESSRSPGITGAAASASVSDNDEKMQKNEKKSVSPTFADYEEEVPSLDNSYANNIATSEENRFEESIIDSLNNGEDTIVQVMFNYEPKEDGDLQLIKGEIIKVLDTSGGKWWQGEKKDGSTGLFPSNYVKQV